MVCTLDRDAVYQFVKVPKVTTYLIGINLPGRNLPIFEKGGKFLPGNLKHGQVMERRLKKKSYTLTMTMTEIL